MPSSAFTKNLGANISKCINSNCYRNEYTTSSTENDFHSRGHQRSFVDNDFRSLAVNHGLEVVELFAIRYSRLRRFRFLGTGICGSRWFKNWMRRANGKRHLVLVAEKQLSVSPSVPMKPAA